jgi:mRNA-degrading endonuclease toxin of MazEF toxin-antitoxin module
VRLGRGALWYAEWPSVGDKPVLVISPEYMNTALRSAIVVRVTSAERGRTLPTFVTISPRDAPGLDRDSVVICNDVATLPDRAFRRRIAALSAQRLVEVEAALRRATGLD